MLEDLSRRKQEKNDIHIFGEKKIRSEKWILYKYVQWKQIFYNTIFAFIDGIKIFLIKLCAFNSFFYNLFTN